MNPVIIKGTKVVSIAKAKAPAVKKLGGKAISFLMTTGAGMEVVDKTINARTRNKMRNDFLEMYSKATSNEEKEMLMKYYKPEYIYNIPDTVNQINCCAQSLC